MVQKTNALRILDQAKITHQVYEYAVDEAHLDGITAAQKLGKPVEMVYKTLVAKGAKGEHLVFVIPVAWELNLKKAAKAVGEKSVAMIKMADIQQVTGYIRGGCSPLGMKKKFRTVIDESAAALPWMIVSAGKRGLQMELSPMDLATLCGADFAPLCGE